MSQSKSEEGSNVPQDNQVSPTNNKRVHISLADNQQTNDRIKRNNIIPTPFIHHPSPPFNFKPLYIIDPFSLTKNLPTQSLGEPILITTNLPKPPKIIREDPLFYFTHTKHPPTFDAHFVTSDEQPKIFKRFWEREMDSRDDADETKVRSPYGDTGANINLITPALAKKLGLPVKSYPQPIYVQFGQGETAKITHYIELYWIGHAAIADIPRSLISISAICAIGPLDVSFNARRIKIVDKGDPLKPIIYRKKISPNGLYEIDLEKFLKTKPPKHFEHYQEMHRLAGSKAKFLSSEHYQEIFSDSDSDNDQEVPLTTTSGTVYAVATEDPPLSPPLDACPFCNVCNIANILDVSLHHPQEDDEDILLQVPFTPANSRVLSKGTRISKELLDRVLWLHKCTGHQGRELFEVALGLTLILQSRSLSYEKCSITYLVLHVSLLNATEMHNKSVAASVLYILASASPSTTKAPSALFRVKALMASGCAKTRKLATSTFSSRRPRMLNH